jgi:hypothetical protein
VCMKAVANYYREIEYVVVSELPELQQNLLRQYPEADYIKISIDGKVTGPCLQYKQYSLWYSTIYSKAAKERVVEKKTIPVKRLAWTKA